LMQKAESMAGWDHRELPFRVGRRPITSVRRQLYNSRHTRPHTHLSSIFKLALTCSCRLRMFKLEKHRSTRLMAGPIKIIRASYITRYVFHPSSSNIGNTDQLSCEIHGRSGISNEKTQTKLTSSASLFEHRRRGKA
jgi:hypothetical protein